MNVARGAGGNGRIGKNFLKLELLLGWDNSLLAYYSLDFQLRRGFISQKKKKKTINQVICGRGERQQEWPCAGPSAGGWQARWEVCEHPPGGRVLATRTPQAVGKVGTERKGWGAGRRHTFPSFQLFLRLVCLAVRRNLCNIRRSLGQLLISCWKELGIKVPETPRSETMNCCLNSVWDS